VGRGWAGKRRERGMGRGAGEVEGREREGPQVTVKPGPLRALLRHWKHTRHTSVVEMPP